MPPAKIAQAQKLAATFPPHPDMSLAGTTALLDGVVEGSYDFFALHQHPSWVCGKAWHHEDRHDPGDMDKYFIRLQLVQSDLHLSVRVPDGAADPTDPDVTSMPLLDGSATSCPADAAKSPPWSAWQTFVFEPDN